MKFVGFYSLESLNKNKNNSIKISSCIWCWCHYTQQNIIAILWYIWKKKCKFRVFSVKFFITEVLFKIEVLFKKIYQKIVYQELLRQILRRDF